MNYALESLLVITRRLDNRKVDVKLFRDSAYNCRYAVNAMLDRHPDREILWQVWDFYDNLYYQWDTEYAKLESAIESLTETVSYLSSIY